MRKLATVLLLLGTLMVPFMHTATPEAADPGGLKGPPHAPLSSGPVTAG
ncbi:hypothetical protein NS506_07315 [Nocardia seriolae]|uniref:Uncharacterized protein n=1 Tax=Nocardia seriolae TaxID=37332 RepID=A0ABC9YKS7_9NOCA|nr:hypothetical protein [Nocardia seriolae]GEM21995.1 hypothetical protein NS2_02340 [Nocardia seriolae NBRC 15557]APB01335.1 hypothetical protein NS506_07315 [Nocardia seriolae]MTJ69921.1 hypothetical protein [Nocardia seriolae]MTL16254.1 hypothetical protein [Nocardia seriolae]BEK90920.1 hypothetical protein NSERKGN1266_68710 [Nocardia seriolae]